MNDLKWGILVKKIQILCSLLLIFSYFLSSFFTGIHANAETTKQQVVDEAGVSITYTVKAGKQSTIWRLFIERKSEEKEVKQRLQLKIVNQADEEIEYPTVEGFQLEDAWWGETEAAASLKTEVSLQLPKAETQLKVYAQLVEEQLVKGETKQKIRPLSDGEPFVLEAKKTVEEPTASLLPTKASLPFDPLQTKMYTPLYTNKEPEYTTSDDDVYPTHFWQPEGQSNVRNHQGGFTDEADWDGVSSWDVTNDQHDSSYIYYGDTSEDANIAIRKYAQQTDKKDEFKVKLNVRGNVTNKPGLDIVFLLDNSDSMDPTGTPEYPNNTRKRYAEKALEKIVDELKKIYNPSAKNIRIGGHIFSDYGNNAWGNKSGQKRTYALSDNTSDWDNLVQEYQRAVAMGGTFTQRGLKESQDIFEAANDSSGRKQILFVLTDGSPNYSWVPKKYTASAYMYYDKYYLSDFDTGSKGNYKSGSVLGAQSFTTKLQSPYMSIVNSHITPMISTAYDLKAAGTEIHTISVQITRNVNERHTKAELLRGLYKMATKRADSPNGPDEDSEADYFYHNVENPGELVGTFKEWYETIVRTVEDGVVTDPLGEMVELVDTPTWKQVGSAPTIEAEAEPELELSDNNRQVNVKNINLTGKQEIEIEYTVRLKATDPAFVSNQWYPVNQQTTLEPTPRRTNDCLDFGVPSVRMAVEDFVIPVQKNWLDTAQGQPNYWGLQPQEITAVLQKQNGDSWEDKHQLILNASGDWQGEFPAVEGGDQNSYRVVEKVADAERAAGYKTPTYTTEAFTSETLDPQGVVITNELMTTDYSFKKVGHDGKLTFTGDQKPAFSLIDGKTNQIVLDAVQPDDQGNVTFSDLPIGTYEIEETQVPVGYQKMTNISLVIAENSQGTGLTVTANNQTDPLKIVNTLKDFELVVEKVDEDKQPLKGAVFKLIGETTGYEEERSDGPTFTFTGLEPDNYRLEEIIPPGSYEGLSKPYTFTLSADGTVQLGSDPLVSGTGGITSSGNNIELTVTNIRYGSLPYTGDRGRHLFFLAAAGVMLLGVLLGIAYYQVNRIKR